jgi:predicted PurR-regulated permease PerM
MSESAVRRALPIYLALLWAILTVAGILLLVELADVLVLLFVSALFASALSGPADRLEHLKIPRAVSAAGIYLLTLAVAGAVLWLVVPPLLGQTAELADEAPSYVDRYEGLRTRYESLRDDFPALAPFDRQLSRLGDGILEWAGGAAVSLPSALFRIFLDVLAVFVVSLLLVTNRERIGRFVLSLVHPDHREQTRRVGTKMWERVGYYLRAKVIVMAIVGAITYGALLLIGVPFALMLAVVVALGEAIPRAGPWLARIPLLAVALLEGLVTFGLTFAASVVIENAKGYVISPVVEGDQLDIHPLLVFVSVLVGGALLGVAGAFIAVPFAAMVQVLVEEVVVPWRRRRIEAPLAGA